MSSKPSVIMYERRREGPRVRVDMPAVAGTPRGPVSGKVHELSKGGCFLLAPPQPVGTSITLQFQVEGTSIACTGEVRYKLTRRDSQGMGIRFNEIDPTAAMVIQRFVAIHGTAD